MLLIYIHFFSETYVFFYEKTSYKKYHCRYEKDVANLRADHELIKHFFFAHTSKVRLGLRVVVIVPARGAESYE